MSASLPSVPVLVFQKRGLEIFLGLLLFSMVIMNLPKGWEGAEHLWFSVVVSLMVFSGWVAVASHPQIGRVTGALAITMVSLRWYNFYESSPVSSAIELVVTLFFYVLFSTAIADNVFDRREVTRFKLEGAIVVYLLVAIVWAQLYMLVELLSPGSFQFASELNHLPDVRKNLVYFSFTTLTTLGIGDILPVGSMARSLVAIEACIGVLFPNILIARLVSLEIIHSCSPGK